MLCGFYGLLGMLLDFLVVPGPLPKYGRKTLPHKHFADVKNKKVHKKVHTPKPLVLRQAVYHWFRHSFDRPTAATQGTA